MPSFRADLDGPKRKLEYRRAGIELSVPRATDVRSRRAPQVFRATLDEAVVAAYAYRRREQLPRSGGELRAARRRLVREVRRREGAFRLLRAGTRRVAGARAVELVGDQTLSRRRYRTRSLHVFRGRGEYVLDMLAPVGQFRRLDRGLFAPLVRSLDRKSVV